jgi:hypothetical protein
VLLWIIARSASRSGCIGPRYDLPPPSAILMANLTHNCVLILQNVLVPTVYTLSPAPLSFARTPITWNITSTRIVHSDLNSNWTGAVVLFPFITRMQWGLVLPAQAQHAVGALLAPMDFFSSYTRVLGYIVFLVLMFSRSTERIPGYQMYLQYEWRADTVTIPVGESSGDEQKLLLELLANSTNGEITLISWNPEDTPNRWKEMCESNWMIAWQIVLGTYCVVLIAISFFKLALFVRYNGFQLSVHQVSLGMICFGMTCTIRCARCCAQPPLPISNRALHVQLGRLFYCINPLMCRRAWEDFADDIFLSTSAPFSFSSVFLITLYLYAHCITLIKYTRVFTNTYQN